VMPEIRARAGPQKRNRCSPATATAVSKMSLSTNVDGGFLAQAHRRRQAFSGNPRHELRPAAPK
jgi:hypothetical protein